MSKKYKIKYNRDKCIGAGTCAKFAPETWRIDKEGLAVMKKSTFGEKDLRKNIKAAKSCPTCAIEIYDEKGKQIV